MSVQAPKPRQPVTGSRAPPAPQKSNPGIPVRVAKKGKAVQSRGKQSQHIALKQERQSPPTPHQTDSEDEAYGGSAGSEEEELKTMLDSTETDTTIDEFEEEETPRRIPLPVSKRSLATNKKAAPVQTTPRRATRNKGVPTRKSTNRLNGLANGEDYDLQQTFGDEERKCVKEFREAYNSFNKNGEAGRMPLEDEVQHLCALADVYKRSAIGTLNIHNLLRASGLYNYCLIKCEKDRPHLYANIKDSLIQFEEAAMRRVLKLRSTQCPLFAHEKKRSMHLKELKETRDICAADFENIKDGLREFPSAHALLKQKSPSTRHLAAEENIMATTSLMFGEVTERMRGFLAANIGECLEMQGPPPCKYAVVGNHKLGAKDLSPFDPISIFIIIENDSAGVKAFFRNTLALLGMKINNLGETSLPSLNIRSIAWFTTRATPSGLAMANYIEDTEKKEFSTVPLECIRTPKDLLKLAVSDKQVVRHSIIDLLHNMTFITGDLKLFKELVPVRSAVLQREQTEKSYKKALFSKYQGLVRHTDPLSKFALQEGNEDEIQSNVMGLVNEFVTYFSDMEKNFSSEGTINRLEEMMPTGAANAYSSTTIATDVREKQGVVSTISTRLNTPQSLSPSPEPVRLPDIPVVVKKKDTWTFQEVKSDDSNPTPTIEPDAALKKLKEKKANLRTEYRKSVYFHVPREAVVRRSTTQGGGAKSDISSSTESSGMSSTWKKTKKKPRPVKPKTPPNMPTPEPIERFVYIVPAFDGRQKKLLSQESARYLVLLHSLTSAITLSNRSATCLISTKHQQAFTIGSKDYEAAYIRILQVVVPFISTLTQLVFGAEVTSSNLKKGLLTLDLNADDDEFVVALTQFQNRKYTHCCKAIYKYLENRSDITFIGEPFAADFTEVCQELLEDGLISPERYWAVHLLIAHCQMRRDAIEEALTHWSLLLSKAETHKDKANVYEHISECCVKLGRRENALKSINRAISLYSEAKATTKTINFDEEIDKLQAMKENLQR